MESYEDDDHALPVLDKPSSPIPRPKLKRLKKAASPSMPLSPPSPPSTDPMVMNAPTIQIPSAALHPAEIPTSSFDAMDGETFGEGIGPAPDLDPLFSYPRVEESCDALYMPSRERNEVGSRRDEGTVADEEPRKKKTVKRRLGLEKEECDANKRTKKTERSRKLSVRDGAVREKRKLEKARKAELEFLHAESQKLLRVVVSLAGLIPLLMLILPHGILFLVQIQPAEKLTPKRMMRIQNWTMLLVVWMLVTIHRKRLCQIVSSPGEASDKENIRPRTCKLRDMDASTKDDLVKAFLDDEAEEEDDSDCDLLRFPENEDENETDEHEDLDDIFATGYKDAPIDQEKRNELHQKWLEQQDAAETNNVIQRLKSGQGRGDTTFLNGDYDNYDGGEDDDRDVNDNSDGDDVYGYAAEWDDETADKHHSTETTRQSLKKAKKMIARMFTDENDVYIPSDDEETEKDLIRHHILKQNEEPSFVSPVENENSREVFGLIKKLNIAPGPKKKGKASASSVFDILVASGSSNSSSKPSFVKRAGNSLPSSHKQGSTSIRAFIFGRDDSNSRSNISTSEITTDMAPKESRPAKSAMTDKFSSSQLNSSIMETKVHNDTESGLSLFNILRQTSLQFDQKSENRSSVGSHANTESQAAYQFSAFKVRRRTMTNSRS